MWFRFQGYFGTCSLSYKGLKKNSPFIIEIFHMFSISLCCDNNNNSDDIDIKCKNCNRTVIYQFQNEEINSFITTFFLRVVLHDVGLSWILYNKKRLKFDIEEHFHQYMDNVL